MGAENPGRLPAIQPGKLQQRGRQLPTTAGQPVGQLHAAAAKAAGHIPGGVYASLHGGATGGNQRLFTPLLRSGYCPAPGSHPNQPG